MNPLKRPKFFKHGAKLWRKFCQIWSRCLFAPFSSLSTNNFHSTIGSLGGRSPFMQAILNYIFVFLASILHGKTSLSVHKIAAWNRISKRPIERSLRKKYLFSKWANPGLFSFIFVLFQANNTIFTTNKYEKYQVHPVYGGWIRTHDLPDTSRLP